MNVKRIKLSVTVKKFLLSSEIVNYKKITKKKKRNEMRTVIPSHQAKLPNMKSRCVMTRKCCQILVSLVN